MNFLEKIFSKKNNKKSNFSFGGNREFTAEELLRFKIVRIQISLNEEKTRLKEFLKKKKKK